MTDRIYRYEVPVDDQWHDIELGGAILHVAARDPYKVEFWALHYDGATLNRRFRVFGTGQPLPDDRSWIPRGSALAGPFVWHLIEGTPGDEGAP